MGDPDVLNGGGGHTESLLFFTYIFTARRRVGWVGDTLPFCAVLLLSVCFSDRKLLWFNPHSEFFSGLDATVS